MIIIRQPNVLQIFLMSPLYTYLIYISGVYWKHKLCDNAEVTSTYMLKGHDEIYSTKTKMHTAKMSASLAERVFLQQQELYCLRTISLNW